MDDLISRQAAIDAICKEWCNRTNSECVFEPQYRQYDGCDDVKAIENLPPAQQEQRWIPVSEKLPELGHRVLFKMWNNDVHIGILLKLNDGLKITLGATGIGYVYSFENVIAWMPLPKPYQ